MGELDAVHTKLDALLSRVTVIETRLNVWQQMVIPMVTGFVGVVGGIVLSLFALKG